MDPELQQILSNRPSVPGLQPGMDMVQVRGYLTATTTGRPKVDTIHEKDLEISMRDGEKISIRTYRPSVSSSEGGRPVFVVYHGGGYCLGDLTTEELLCRRWTENFGGIAVNVAYRLAPEHPFPTGVNDAFDALKWIAANYAQLDINPSKGFLIGGVSGGATFAAVLSHLYRDARLQPPLTGLYLAVPAIVLPEVVPEQYKAEYQSRSQNTNDIFLTEGAEKLFMENYKPDSTSPLACPLLFPTGHKNLPPTYLQICGMDPLRDEDLLYERILREECGVKTKFDLYPGLPHGFWAYFPGAEFTLKHAEDSKNGLAWLVDQVVG